MVLLLWKMATFPFCEFRGGGVSFLLFDVTFSNWIFWSLPKALGLSGPLRRPLFLGRLCCLFGR